MNTLAYIEEEKVQGCKTTIIRIPLGEGFVAARFVGSELQGYPNHILKRPVDKDYILRGTSTEVSSAFVETLTSLAALKRRVENQWSIWNPKAKRPRLHQ